VEAVRFVDIRISVLLGYCKGSIGLPTRLLVMESNEKAAS
jgi:hypothetical protein